MERGAKAYAPSGAGRKTGHQKPVVAAKGKKREDDMVAELDDNSVKGGKRKEKRKKGEGTGRSKGQPGSLRHQSCGRRVLGTKIGKNPSGNATIKYLVFSILLVFLSRGPHHHYFRFKVFASFLFLLLSDIPQTSDLRRQLY